MAHAFDHHNAALSEGEPSLLWSRPCLEALLDTGWHGFPAPAAIKRSAAAPRVSPIARRVGGAAPGGGGSGESDPPIFGAGAPPGRGDGARQNSPFPPLFLGVALTTVIPGGKAIERCSGLRPSTPAG